MDVPGALVEFHTHGAPATLATLQLAPPAFPLSQHFFRFGGLQLAIFQAIHAKLSNSGAAWHSFTVFFTLTIDHSCSLPHQLGKLHPWPGI